MGDVVLPFQRLLQYLSLMLLFGLPLLQRQALVLGVGLPAATLRSWLIAVGGAAVLAQLLEAPLKAARLLGVPWQQLDVSALAWYLFGTPAGLAWTARSAVLLAMALWLACLHTRHRVTGAFLLLAGCAVSTLLWNGHAAMSEGIAGAARLFMGGLHLLAASVWLGTISGFVLLLGHRAERERLHALMHEFASTGSLLVVILMVSGTVHYAWIHHWQGTLVLLPVHPYDRWMLVKLVLFALMLMMAAMHRWWLVPRLRTSASTVPSLRISLRLEFLIAVMVVAAVAILGTMSPGA